MVCCADPASYFDVTGEDAETRQLPATPENITCPELMLQTPDAENVTVCPEEAVAVTW
jgi:hypothetical protein